MNKLSLAVCGWVFAACAAKTPATGQSSGGDPIALHSSEKSFQEVTKNQVVLIDLWASWCEPCKQAIPKLRQIHRQFKAQGLVMVGINVGEDARDVQRFVDEAKLDYPMFRDPNYRYSEAMNAPNVPTLLVLNRQGEVIFRSSEPDQQLMTQIESLLAKPTLDTAQNVP